MEEMVINEPVSVLSGNYGEIKAHVRIFRVKWKKTEYRIKDHTSYWSSREGFELIDNFTVKTGAGDVLWLQHYRLKNQWWLNQITLI